MKKFFHSFKEHLNKVNYKEPEKYVIAFNDIKKMSTILNESNVLKHIKYIDFPDENRGIGCTSVKHNKIYFKTINLLGKEIEEVFPIKSLMFLENKKERMYNFTRIPVVEDSVIIHMFDNLKKIESKFGTLYNAFPNVLSWKADLQEMTDYYHNNLDETKELFYKLNYFIIKVETYSSDQFIQELLVKHHSTIERINSVLEEVKDTNFTLNEENKNGINKIMNNLMDIISIRLIELEKQDKEIMLLAEEEEKIKMKLLREQEEKNHLFQQKKIEEVLAFERNFQEKHLL
jgi:hypothetical protein